MQRASSNKLLIISYPFPPIPYSGTYRIMRMCKGLVRLGVEVHVLTINIDPRIPNDFELLKKLPKEVMVHRTAIIDPWLSYQRWLKSGANKKRGSPAKRVLPLFMRLITIPDHQIFWVPIVVRQGLHIIKDHRIKNVLVTSPPVSSLVSGILLKKLADIRFLADLRDPIVGNVAQVNLLNPRDPISRFEKRLLGFIEQSVVNKADVVIANTETHREELSKKYQRNNMKCIYNCFDEDDYKGIDRKKYRKFTIAHVGSMYGLRRPDVLFQAIKRLEKKYSPAELELQILFVGMVDQKLKDIVSEYGIERYVKFLGMVPHKKAIEIMVRSHLLLLIKAAGKDGYGQIPAKFFEYLGTGNKILLIGPKETEAAGILAKLGCGACFEDDASKLYQFVHDEYLVHTNSTGSPYLTSVINVFNYHAMGNKIAGLFR